VIPWVSYSLPTKLIFKTVLVASSTQGIECSFCLEHRLIMTRKNDERPFVCGTDFSAVATEAVDIAAAMARQLETKLVLVHVDQLLGALVSNPLLLEAATLQRRADLDGEARRLRHLETNVEEKFLSGSAFEELVTAATQSKARLIVVGAGFFSSAEDALKRRMT
jgi:nucleotide-binding universal stress UspA family protein